LTAVEGALKDSGANRVVVKEVGFDLANMLDEDASAAGITHETAEAMHSVPAIGLST
jgi:hypothetical protein